MRGLRVFPNVGPALVDDLAQNLDDVIDGYINPQLVEYAHLEHEVYLLVSTTYPYTLLVHWTISYVKI